MNGQHIPAFMDRIEAPTSRICQRVDHGPDAVTVTGVHPNTSDAQRWRLLQAQELIDNHPEILREAGFDV